MQLLRPHLIECGLLALALACALLVRPWRLLAHGSRHDLAPALFAGLLLPCLWWWPGAQHSAVPALLGVNLLLLAVGWPLAIPVIVLAGGWGVLTGAVDPWAAGGLAFWRGALPASLALLAGWAVRRLFGERLMAYLLGRAFLVPVGVTVAEGLLEHVLCGAFQRGFADAASLVVLMAAADGMLTAMVVGVLVVGCPRCLATWSGALDGAGEGEAARVLARAPRPAAQDPS